MTVQPLEETAPTTAEIVPLTVEQYHRMIEAGILVAGEPIELLDGFLVHKDRGPGVTVNPIHAAVIDPLQALLGPTLAGAGCYLRTQNPVTIEPRDEPEPDAAIVRGRPRNFAHRHPGPGDVSCVIEVAETSLQRDRTLKQRIYASAGIPQYVLINLAEGRVEVYEESGGAPGRYGQRRLLEAAAPVPFLLPDGERRGIPARDCLP